jgi:origin recognition complex subunit 1
MPPKKSETKAQKARKWLSGGAITRDDSDDELGTDDLPWEWIYEDDNKEGGGGLPGSKKRKRDDKESGPLIIGAQMGSFRCNVGDTVFLKSSDNQAWVGIICQFGHDEHGDKSAYFMWFSAPQEIRNKGKKRTDFYKVNIYIYK